MASHKGKSKISVDNPVLPSVINLDELPFVNTYFKVVETNCEFDLYEHHNWSFHKYEDVSDDFSFWESLLPQFSFAQTYHFPYFVTSCQAHYLPSQRAIIVYYNETLFYITLESIFKPFSWILKNPYSLFHRFINEDLSETFLFIKSQYLQIFYAREL